MAEEKRNGLMEKLKNKISRKLLIAGLVLIIVLGAMSWVLGVNVKKSKSAAEEAELLRQTIEALQNKTDSGDDGEKFITESKPVITTAMISETLEKAQELVTAEYYYTTAGKYERTKQATVYNWDLQIPLTKKEFTVMYDGVIKASINLESATIDIDEENSTIVVKIPHSEISSHETFEDSLVVVDESDGVFNKITIEDYNGFVAGQKSSMEKKAKEMGLLTNADQQAEELITSLIQSLYGSDSYKISIVFFN